MSALPEQTQERIWGSSGSGSVAESGFAARPASISVTARERCPRRRPTRGHGPAGMRRPPAEAGGSAARPPAVPARPLFVGRRTRRGAHLERWRIWRRLRCRRRVLFFFHFHRNLARDFLYGFDLCAMPGAPLRQRKQKSCQRLGGLSRAGRAVFGVCGFSGTAVGRTRAVWRVARGFTALWRSGKGSTPSAGRKRALSWVAHLGISSRLFTKSTGTVKA